MLDYKTIIIKRYALNMSGTQIAKNFGCSKSRVNDFSKRFEECKTMILNDEVSANAIIKRATKHYTVVINVKEC